MVSDGTMGYAYSMIVSYTTLLPFNPIGNEIEWARLRDFLRLAQKAASSYNPSRDDSDDKQTISRQTIELFLRFLTSRTGLFLKKPLVHELAEAIDGK
jgi:hypothetical protein